MQYRQQMFILLYRKAFEPSLIQICPWPTATCECFQRCACVSVSQRMNNVISPSFPEKSASASELVIIHQPSIRIGTRGCVGGSTFSNATESLSFFDSQKQPFVQFRT